MYYSKARADVECWQAANNGESICVFRIGRGKHCTKNFPLPIPKLKFTQALISYGLPANPTEKSICLFPSLQRK